MLKKKKYLITKNPCFLSEKAHNHTGSLEVPAF